jgi:hypothetical protein
MFRLLICKITPITFFSNRAFAQQHSFPALKGFIFVRNHYLSHYYIHFYALRVILGAMEASTLKTAPLGAQHTDFTHL